MLVPCSPRSWRRAHVQNHRTRGTAVNFDCGFGLIMDEAYILSMDEGGPHPEGLIDDSQYSKRTMHIKIIIHIQ